MGWETVCWAGGRRSGWAQQGQEVIWKQGLGVGRSHGQETFTLSCYPRGETYRELGMSELGGRRKELLKGEEKITFIEHLLSA